ncbi:hypothetical protein ACFL6K_03920 [Candidatus Latescibacterota bacterium]
MKYSSDNLKKLIEEIKQRWKMRALKQGSAVLFLSFLLFTALYMLLLYRYELSPLWQTIVVAVSLVLLIAEGVFFIILPLFKRFDDQKIAMFIEEKFPELEDRLNSAVEVETLIFKDEKDALINLLLKDAAQKARVVSISTVVDRKKEQILTYAAFGIFVLSLLFVLSFWNELMSITSRMGFLFTSNDYPAQITVSPGDVQIEKGETQEIFVTLRNKSSNDVILHYKAGSDIWREENMERGINQLDYMFQFESVQEQIFYYVEFNKKVSSNYSISIYEYPKADRIDLAYSYPSYTGLPDRTELNSGNIRGLKGSEVTLTVTTTGAVETGVIVLNDTTRINLSHQGDGVFSGMLTIEEYGSYSVNLTDSENKNNKFPEEYLITPVEDEWPLITITAPKRDIRVNPIEEVIITSMVEDDFGVNSLKLKYSINGMDEESIDLAEGISKGLPEVSGSYVMYLEDFSLEPGDIISYYLESEDNFHINDPSMTDMYFIELTPFDASYTQVNNQEDGSEPQEGAPESESQMVTSQQMIIAATWKLYRLRNQKTPEDFDESLDALVQAQSNLRDNIEERINSTSVSEEMVTDDDYMEISNLLRSAVSEMETAQTTLESRELREALKPEQRALNFLLKADAKNKEKQVQLSQQQASSSSSSSSASEERMTELMDLELDISQDKYEIQQQNQSQQAQEMDSAMEKLRELAERQQELAEQTRNDVQEEEEDPGRFLDRLKRDQEELRQQAEELSSSLRQMAQNNDQMSRQMQERMDQIAERMREAEEELANNNIQESLSSQQQALNELNKLRQDLQFSMSDDAREMLSEFTQNFDLMQERESEFSDELNEIYKKTTEENDRAPEASELQHLTEMRQAIIENLETLENQARAIEEQTLQENPDIAADMRNIRNSIQRENLERNMRESESFMENGWLSYSLPLERMITNSIDSLEEQIDRLSGTLPVTEEEQLSRSLADIQEMRQRLEDVMNQANQDNAEPSSSPGNEQQSASGEQPNEISQQQQENNQQAQGQQGQQGEEQSGEPGQSSQQGQQAQQGQQGQGGQGQQNNRQDNGARDTAALQLEQLMEQFDQLMEQMEGEFTEDAELQRTIETARSSAVSSYTGELLGEDSEEHFRQKIFDPLSQLEMEILKRFDELNMEKRLYSERSADVPPEYKTMVDEYFKSIANENNSD